MNDLLKVVICGSVDDGKSTLIGHMLYDAKLVFTDEKQMLEIDSKIGNREGDIDYSLLLDGLMAEREQKITIDVAYRYFTTKKRSFIVADTPGHEEYTRNMAVGASFSDLAVILVDSSHGILPQTRRHAMICSMMGIRYFCFVVNKMDLSRYSQFEYSKIEKQIRELAIDLGLSQVTIIPVSATEGDNIIVRSANMDWFQGKTLFDYLETVSIQDTEQDNGFIMPVQRVCRPYCTFRGFEGQIESGSVRVGDEITVLPSQEKAHIEDILIAGEEGKFAEVGMPVTLTLDREIDVSRGCVIATDKDLNIGDMFAAQILWMDDEILMEGKNFLLKLGTKEIPVLVMKINYKVDINSGEHRIGKTLYKNEIAVCEISTSQPIVYKRFAQCRTMGSFILIDRLSNMTSACGVILYPLRRADDIIFQKTDITRSLRSERMNQKPITIWFTGLSGAGKSTVANALERRLFAEGKYTMLLDGDNIRLGLNKNLGFEPEDRIENIRRVAEVSKLMNDAGLIVLAALISPYKLDRENAKDIIGRENFVEVYVSTSFKICMKRDVKGLYKKAENNEIPNFTGISSVYEEPEHPNIIIDTEKLSVSECVDMIMECLWKR